jgi:hypothetical protein
VVTILLLVVAIVRREKFDRAAYWWTTLALVVVLSLGAKATYGSQQFSLPSDWLYRVFPPYRLIRVPARFNLFAAVIAALIAGSGLRAILQRLPNVAIRTAVVAGLAVVALADLSMIPFADPAAIPPTPPIYAKLLRERPGARLLEIPQFRSDGSLINCICGYWQSTHQGKTSAGYSGHPNTTYDNMIFRPSPFNGEYLADPNYLADPYAQKIDLLSDVDFDDYTWLYLNYHQFPYVVLHHSELTNDQRALALERLRERLSRARTFEDEGITVYETARLKPPSGLTILLAHDWRQRTTLRGETSCAVGRSARVVVYQPTSSEPVVVTLVASAFREPRTVRLKLQGRELVRWRFAPGDPKTVSSPPFLVPSGIQELVLESDGESRPAHNHEMASEGDRTPYSLRVARISVRRDRSGEFSVVRRINAKPRSFQIAK